MVHISINQTATSDVRGLVLLTLSLSDRIGKVEGLPGGLDSADNRRNDAGKRRPTL